MLAGVCAGTVPSWYKLTTVVNRLFTTILAALCALSTAAAQEAVRIFASSERAVFTVDTPKKTGTGFVLTGGFFVTCYHVVKGATGRIKLRELPTVRLSYLAHDEKADIAVFALDSAMPSYLRIGPGTPNVGATVYVIGTPLGALDRSISNGIISQVRSISGVDLLQLTAAISPGSSGSPVLDSNGQVVGMVKGYLKDGQANNFAVSAAVITRVIASRGAAKARMAPISQVAPKHLKTTGQPMKCQFIRPTGLYREPNLIAGPVFYVRAKRITTARRTVAAEWVAIKLSNVSTVYAPAKDVKLYNANDKNGRNLSDPLNATPPNGLERLIREVDVNDPEYSSASVSKLLSYGPGIVKHVFARFEFARDPWAEFAIVSLGGLGRAAKPDFLLFMKDGSETQRDALALLWRVMARELEAAERAAHDETGEDAQSSDHRDAALKSIKRLSWLRDQDMEKHYRALLASWGSRENAVMILAHLQLKKYKREVEKLMESKFYWDATPGFEAFCRLADKFDSSRIKTQFYRLSETDPSRTESGENTNATQLIYYLANSGNETCYKVLLDLLDKEDEWVREKACFNLTLWPREETIARMSPLLNDKSQRVRTQALVTLSEIAPARFVEEAISLSKSKDGYDRLMAVRALGGTKLDRAASYLDRLCQDEDETVRKGARAGLAALGSPTAVRALILMLDSPDPAVRKEARAALKKLGKEPPP